MSDQNNAVLAQMAEFMLEERVEKRQKELKEKQRKDAQREQGKQQENFKRKVAFNKAMKCDGLLGSHSPGVTPDIKRCAWHHDEFSNGKRRMYCTKCHWELQPGDTKEFIFRDGQKLPNGHRMSFKEAYQFLFTFQNAKELMSRAFRVVAGPDPMLMADAKE